VVRLDERRQFTSAVRSHPPIMRPQHVANNVYHYFSECDSGCLIDALSDGCGGTAGHDEDIQPVI
jgi:hypothetical protein